MRPRTSPRRRQEPRWMRIWQSWWRSDLNVHLPNVGKVTPWACRRRPRRGVSPILVEVARHVASIAPEPSSMVVAWHEGAAPADQEVEVDAFVGLQHVIDVELPVAAAERRRRPLPVLHARRELGIADVEMNAPIGHVELDEITAAHGRQGTAVGGFGRGMQNDRAI